MLKLSEAKQRIGLVLDYGYKRSPFGYEKRWRQWANGQFFNVQRTLAPIEILRIVDLEMVLKYIERDAERTLIYAIKNPPMR